MKKIIVIIVLIIGTMQVPNAQETEEWETQTFVTGYFALNGEFIDLPVFEEVNGRNMGVGIAEASVLTMIKPLEELKINSVITYKPRLDLNRVIAELSGEWNFSEQIKIKVGRFLLPVNPINTQYYAPMNTGIALPIFVTNHNLFPLNINGIDLNGRFYLSDNFSINYNLITGQYKKTEREETGIMGYFGRDGVYLNSDTKKVISGIAKLDNLGETPEYSGSSARLAFNFGDNIEVGFAGFYATEENSIQSDLSDPTTFFETDVNVLNYGTDIKLNFNDLTLKAFAWLGAETPEDKKHFETYDYSIYYGELAYLINNILSPYAKYEYMNGRTKDFSRLTTGINYRPFFETTFKIEYHHYIQDYVDNFNLFQFSVVYSF